MQEKVFKVSYIPYSKKENLSRTSSIVKKIKIHKFSIILLSVIILACSVNFVLLYKFIKLVESLV